MPAAQPAFVTRSTQTSLIFVPTCNFFQVAPGILPPATRVHPCTSSKIHTGIPLGQKIPCENKLAALGNRSEHAGRARPNGDNSGAHNGLSNEESGPFGPLSRLRGRLSLSPTCSQERLSFVYMSGDSPHTRTTIKAEHTPVSGRAAVYGQRGSAYWRQSRSY